MMDNMTTLSGSILAEYNLRCEHFKVTIFNAAFPGIQKLNLNRAIITGVFCQRIVGPSFLFEDITMAQPFTNINTAAPIDQIPPTKLIPKELFPIISSADLASFELTGSYQFSAVTPNGAPYDGYFYIFYLEKK